YRTQERRHPRERIQQSVFTLYIIEAQTMKFLIFALLPLFAAAHPAFIVPRDCPETSCPDPIPDGCYQISCTECTICCDPEAAIPSICHGHTPQETCPYPGTTGFEYHCDDH